MLINADAKQLEWRVAILLSGDAVGKKEIAAKLDIHSDNQRVFGLGEGEAGRLVAKRFVFKLIYGATAFGYASDSDFIGVSTNEKFWQNIIDKFYEKYTGIAEWHKNLLKDVQESGYLLTPSGRRYDFSASLNKRGERVWPQTTIKNYPVQGFGADIMMIARIAVFRRIKALNNPNILLVNTVHDSIVVDCPEVDVEVVANIIKYVFEDLASLCAKAWGCKFDVPMSCDIKIGQDWLNMEEWK